ncbi:hypothetical protein FQN54_004331 [Arachnomyces sp. PD_36]|nr:hypothetical protein FQN54_004331 [Arachnomyces sp. PD_36]
MSKIQVGEKNRKRMSDWAAKIPDEKLQGFPGRETTLHDERIEENARVDYQRRNTAEGLHVHRLAIQKNPGGGGTWSSKAKPNQILSRIDVKEGTSPDDIRRGLEISYVGMQETYQGLNDDGKWVQKPEKLSKKQKAELEKENAKKELNDRKNNGKKNGRGNGKQNGKKGNGKENMKP